MMTDQASILAIDQALGERYRAVRGFTDKLCQPLSAEDCCIQSMPDVSPTRWHLAHTTWFFETFVLCRLPSYTPFDTNFGYLFNSYYNTVGEQFPRHQRGLLSRPSVEEVYDYRAHVDDALLSAWRAGQLSEIEDVGRVVELGLQHEQQHQELMLTDIKHVLAVNPMEPRYHAGLWLDSAVDAAPTWTTCGEGLCSIGHAGDSFHFDNEAPRHRTFVHEFQLRSRLVTCSEYLEFMRDGGYERPELWLSLGWQEVNDNRWRAPAYWRETDGGWREFTLAGARDLDPQAPVCHVSYFEADAFARWAQARLPTEAEWEVVAATHRPQGHFADTLLEEGLALHPQPAVEVFADEATGQIFGDVWEWTASPYVAYPGYQPPAGALGEYNGKFMCNQFVLRGGSCATSSSHIRTTYRNFFPPQARWQFTGIRLAR